MDAKQREEKSRQLAEDVQRFLAGGGTIRKCKPGESAIQITETHKEQSDRIFRQTTVLKEHNKKTHNLTGMTFGQLKVLGEAEAKRRERMWLVQCSCGAIETAPTFRLQNGVKKRCVKCGYASKRKTRENEYEANCEETKRT